MTALGGQFRYRESANDDNSCGSNGGEVAFDILLPGLRPNASARHAYKIDETSFAMDTLNEILTREGLGQIVGTKIGCTTKVMQEFLGMSHPCCGAIFGSTVHLGKGRFDFDSFLHVGVECEIAVRLAAPIEAAHGPHTVDSIVPLVKSVHAAIEVVDDRYVDFVAREPDWRTWVADNFFGAGIVLGEPVTDWQSMTLH